MGRGKSPEPKKRYEKKRKGNDMDMEDALAEFNWLKSVYNEEKDRHKKEQQRLARNARARARRAEKKAQRNANNGD